MNYDLDNNGVIGDEGHEDSDHELINFDSIQIPSKPNVPSYSSFDFDFTGSDVDEIININSPTNIEEINAYANGKGGNDTVSSSPDVDLGYLRLDCGDGDDNAFISNISSGYISGGEGTDIISAHGKDTTLEGGDGDDRITAWGENIILFADNGDDKIFIVSQTASEVYTVNDSAIAGGNGDDIVTLGGNSNYHSPYSSFASDANILVALGDGDDQAIATHPDLVNGIVTIIGEAGNDTITGGGSYVYGGSGDDQLIGLQVNGGVGDDTLTGQVVEISTGNDIILADKLKYIYVDVSKFGADLRIRESGDDVLLTGNNINTKVTTNDSRNSKMYIDSIKRAIRYVNGSENNIDDSECGQIKFKYSSNTSTIEGTNGKDKLKGGKNNDLIYGYDENDKLKGGKGADELRGGKGEDTLQGSKGEDILIGGKGSDVLKGGKGADVFYMSKGQDTIKDFKYQQGDRIGVTEIECDGFSFKEVGSDVLVKLSTGYSILIEDQDIDSLDKTIELFRVDPAL